MIWLSINPRQGNPPKYNVKTKIQDKKACLNTVFYSLPHIPMDSSWTLHGLCITCSKVLIIPSKSCGVPVESPWSPHHLWEPFFDVNSMVMSVSSSEWPYMASPANTEVWYIFGNHFLMWIQRWCWFCDQSDHMWQVWQTQVWYIFRNHFSMWIQWWCWFHDLSDHIWQVRQTHKCDTSSGTIYQHELNCDLEV